MEKISPALYFGIDPSINSTGITCIYADSKQFETNFAIVKGNKLTKKKLQQKKIRSTSNIYYITKKK